MNLVYPALCHYEDGGYWCEFPDLNGCFSDGKTQTEIVENAKEALQGYAESCLERDIPLPKASSIKDIHANENDFVTYIAADITDAGKCVRKNVTIPEWLNAKAERMGINFSRTLQEALLQKCSLVSSL